MFDITDINKCTGCSACANICPVKCIEMVENESLGGFIYPQVNEKDCINCKKCINTCPINKSNSQADFEKQAYACMNKDDSIRIKSTSGGIFYLLAQYVIDNNGIVFGTAYTKKGGVLEAVCDYADNMDDIKRFMGSKYVQSKIGDNYLKCYEFLKQGKLVLFTGTPCQIAGLKSFLPRKFDNLICQDLVCHGVPSHLLFKKYLEEEEAKAGSKIIDYCFRSKHKGWNRPGIEIVFENNKKKYSFLNKETYSKMFLDYASLRNSCYECSFRGSDRVSDITLADFWGIEKVLPEKFDDKGISLVILNTAKGREIFEIISERMDYTKVPLETSASYNSSWHSSPKKPAYRDKIVLNTAKYPYKQLLLRCGRKCMVKMEVQRIKSGVKRLIKPAYKLAGKILLSIRRI